MINDIDILMCKFYLVFEILFGKVILFNLYIMFDLLE